MRFNKSTSCVCPTSTLQYASIRNEKDPIEPLQKHGGPGSATFSGSWLETSYTPPTQLLHFRPLFAQSQPSREMGATAAAAAAGAAGAAAAGASYPASCTGPECKKDGI